MGHTIFLKNNKSPKAPEHSFKVQMYNVKTFYMMAESKEQTGRWGLKIKKWISVIKKMQYYIKLIQYILKIERTLPFHKCQTTTKFFLYPQD